MMAKKKKKQESQFEKSIRLRQEELGYSKKDLADDDGIVRIKKQSTVSSADLNKRVHKNEDFRNVYAASVDGDELTAKAYSENGYVSNDFAKQTRRAQDRFKKYIDEDKDFIENNYGKSAYSQLKADSIAMQRSKYREYFSDYMNTSDFVNASYEEKQKYLGKEEDEAKQNKNYAALATGLSLLSNISSGQAVASSPTSQTLNTFEQTNDSVDESVETYKQAREELKYYKNYRANLYNEENVKKNLKKIQKDKELEKLVDDAYNAKISSDAEYDPYTQLQSGGMSKIGSKSSQQFNEAYQAIKDKGYKDEEIDAFINAYTRNKNAQAAESQAKRDTEFANNHPVLASAGYIGANVLQAGAVPEILNAAVESAYNNEYVPVDINSAAFSATNYRDTVSSTISKNIQKEMKEKTNSEFWSNAVPFAYQTALSIGDFATLSVLPEPVSLAIMGTSAGVSAVKDATERGANADSALLTGLWAGASEIFFEKFSLENLNALKASGKKGIKNAVKDIFKQSFTEGSEEVFTDISNAIGDELINGGLSELSAQYNELLKYYNGDKDKAKSALAKSFGTQLLESYAGGALSGGVMGAYGSLMNNYNLSVIGKDIQSGNSSLTDEPSLYATVSKLNTQSKSAQLFNEISSKGNVKNSDIGELYMSTVKDINSAFSNATDIKTLNDSYQNLSKDTSGELKNQIDYAYNKAAKKFLAAANSKSSSKHQKNGNKKTNSNSASESNQSSEDNGADTVSKSKQDVINTLSAKISNDNTFAIDAVNNDTGNNVKVTKVVSSGKGDVNFNTSAGKTISSADITFQNDVTEKIVTDASNFGSGGAALYIKTALENGKITSSQYKTYQAYSKQMYDFGIASSPFDVIEKQISPIINTLGYDTAKAFYNAGIADGSTLNATSSKSANAPLYKSGAGKVNNETSDHSLDKIFKAVAENLHININYVNDGGENGSFNPATATITVVKGAKRGDLTTLAHEVGEYGRANNYNEYKDYVDTVINYLYEINAVSTQRDILAYHRA